MKNIMYHYIRPNHDDYKYFNNLDVDTFRRQLDYFEKEFGFIAKEDYIQAIKSKKNIDGVVLSFDDGLKDHYIYAAAELNKRGLWGSFYIPTGIYQNSNKLLSVHRVHYLNGKYGSTKILKDALTLIDQSMLENEKINEFDKDIYQFTEYEEDAKELRRLFNYFLKYEYRDLVLDKLMLKYFDESKLHKKVYLSLSNIKEMHDDGHIIGSHTVSHPVLSRLTYKEQMKEIHDSFNFLSEICNIEFKSFCYPYGYKSSYNEITFQALSELKIDEAVIFDNKTQGDINDRFQLSRIDCNQFMEIK